MLMMTQNADKKREQIQMFCMDDMVPQDHLLRIIDKAINWNFIYDLVEEKYSPNQGRPSMDPVMLLKIPFIQYQIADITRSTYLEILYINGCSIFACRGCIPESKIKLISLRCTYEHRMQTEIRDMLQCSSRLCIGNDL